jgi:hypothetical protein
MWRRLPRRVKPLRLNASVFRRDKELLGFGDWYVVVVRAVDQSGRATLGPETRYGPSALTEAAWTLTSTPSPVTTARVELAHVQKVCRSVAFPGRSLAWDLGGRGDGLPWGLH